jgi:hypothetical protein
MSPYSAGEGDQKLSYTTATKFSKHGTGLSTYPEGDADGLVRRDFLSVCEGDASVALADMQRWPPKLRQRQLYKPARITVVKRLAANLRRRSITPDFEVPPMSAPNGSVGLSRARGEGPDTALGVSC